MAGVFIILRLSVADALTLCLSLSSLSHSVYLMSVSLEVQQFINKSLADNNKALLDQISKLVADSADNVKRASVEAADEQLREIKKIKREEPKFFKRKGNELQYKFNAKLQDSFEEAKSHLAVNAIDKNCAVCLFFLVYSRIPFPRGLVPLHWMRNTFPLIFGHF